MAMSWVNDILGKSKEKDVIMSPEAIKESAKVFSSALLNKREQKRMRQNKGASDELSNSSGEDDPYFSKKGELKYADLEWKDI